MLHLKMKNHFTQFFYKQRNSINDVITSPASSQTGEHHGLFWRHVTSCDVAWHNVIIEVLHYVLMVYYGAFQ